MAERTGFEPVEGRLALHRFSKPAHSTTLPSLLKPETKDIEIRERNRGSNPILKLAFANAESQKINMGKPSRHFKNLRKLIFIYLQRCF
jgi:hypothetical protein